MSEVDFIPPASPAACGCSICAGGGNLNFVAADTPTATPNGLGGPDAWTTILAGTTNYRWNAAVATGTPTFVTFSFMDALPTYASAATFPGFASMAESMRDGVRSALQAWSAISGIVFLETDAGQGDMRIGMHNFSTTANAQFRGYAYYPYESSTYLGFAPGNTGDIYLNSGQLAPTDPLSVGGNRSLILHEIGHAIGLKHPFSTSNENPNLLDANLDNTINTIMAYNGDRQSQPMPFDVTAARFLYGTTAHAYTWNRAANQLTVNGSANADVILGIEWNDILLGNDGNDSIVGQEGADSIYGGSGSDTLYAAIPGSTNDATANWLLGGIGNDTLFGGFGADHLYGGDNDSADSGADVLNGDAGADALYGEGGDDRLNGGTGADTMSGGADNDTYDVDSTGDTIIEAVGGGFEIIYARSGMIIGANLEYIRLDGTFGAFLDATNSSLNTLIDDNGTNTRISGGSANNLYAMYNRGTFITDTGGTDTIYHLGSGSYTMPTGIEILCLLSNDATGVANSGDAVLFAFGTHNTMIGGIGNDLFMVTSATNVVQQGAVGGFDTLWVNTASYVLPTGVELGTAIAPNSRVIGLDGATGTRILSAGSTNTTLQSSTANETLFGNGLGVTYDFNANFGRDIIGGFTDGSDRIDLRDLAVVGGFAGITIVGAMSGTAPIATITINGNTANSIIIYGTPASQLSAADFLFA